MSEEKLPTPDERVDPKVSGGFVIGLDPVNKSASSELDGGFQPITNSDIDSPEGFTTTYPTGKHDRIVRNRRNGKILSIIIIILLLLLTAGFLYQVIYGSGKKDQTYNPIDNPDISSGVNNSEEKTLDYTLTINGSLKVQQQAAFQNITIGGTTQAQGLVATDITTNNLTINGNAVIIGSLQAAGFAGDGSQLTNVDAITLNGLGSEDILRLIRDSTVRPAVNNDVALRNTPNTFAGVNTFQTNTNFNSDVALQGVLTGQSAIFSTNVAAMQFTQNGNIVCDSSGNCGAGGGGVAGTGTAGRIPMFTGVATVGNSLMSQSGSMITVAGTLAATALQGDALSVANGAFAVNTSGAITAATGLNSTGVITFGSLGAGVLKTNASGVLSSGNLVLGTDISGNYVANLGTLTGLTTTGNSGTGSTPTLSVVYGSTANTAAQGNTTLSFSGSGNLSGTVSGTVGGGITTNTLSIINNPSFSGLISANGGLSATNVAASGTLTLSGLGAGIVQANSSGVVTSGNLDRNSTQLTSQTSVANGGTGAATAGAARTNLGAAASGANSDITSLSAATSVGGTGALTLQGNASTVINATAGGFTTSVGFAAPTANVSYLFATATAGTYNICTTAGNCAGVGGGVTTAGGTANTIAMFTGSNTIANSILSQSGTTVTVAGTMVATALQGSGSAITNLNGTNIASGTVGVSVGGTGAGSFTSNGVLYGGGTGALQVTAAGQTGQCLTGNTGSAPTWVSCTSVAGGSSSPTGAAGGDLGGTYPNPTVVGLYNKPLSISSLAAANILVFDGNNWVNAAVSGDLAINAAGVATIATGSVTNAKLANSAVTVTAGTGLGGGGAVSLGGSITLNVAYGSTTTTAVRGDTTLVCPSGIGNLSGGGDTITLGAGGTCGSLSVSATPSFTSLSLTNALTPANGGTGISSTAANGQLLIGNGSGYSLSVLSRGTGISINNGAGSITIGVNSDVCTTSNNCAVAGGSGNYIQNQTATTQTADFKINGTGSATTSLQSAAFDAVSAGSLSIGASTASSVSVAKTGVTTTVNGGLTVAQATDIQGSLKVALSGTTSSTQVCQNASGQLSGCSGLSGGVTTVGAIDGGTYNSNGASISGSTLYMQTASTSQVGLVNIAAQTFGGIKTFNDSLTAASGVLTNSVDRNSAGQLLLGTGANTTSLQLGGSTSATTLVQASGTVGVRSTTNNTSAFQIQNSGGGAIFNADTTNSRLSVGGASSTARFAVDAGNGSTWQANNSVGSGWNGLTYGNGTFVAVGGGSTRVMTSSDGITWTGRTASAAIIWNTVTYGNNLFVAGGNSNNIMTSPDGITWTSRTSSTSNFWLNSAYGGGVYVLMAQGGTTTNQLISSNDGINWAGRTIPQASSWSDVTYGNGLFVAVSQDGTNRVMTSPNGSSWTGRNVGTTYSWNAVTFGNGQFVAIANSGDVMTSPDGITWTARPQSLTLGNQWSSIAYGDGIYTAVSRATQSIQIATSRDGITWTVRAHPVSGPWEAVAHGNGRFVAVNSTNLSAMISVTNNSGLEVLGASVISGTLNVSDLMTAAALSVAGNTTMGGTLAVTGATTLTGNLTATTGTFSGLLTLSGHISTGNTSGTTSATFAGAGCTTTSVSLTGNDTAGTISITTDSGTCTNGGVANVSFATSYVTIPYVVITPSNFASANINDYVLTTKNGFTVNGTVNLASSTTYTFNYHVMQ